MSPAKNLYPSVPCILCPKQQQHLVSGWLLRAERSLLLLVRSFACLLIQLAASSTLPSRLHVCSASHPESSTNRRSILLCARFNSPGVVLNRFKLRPLSPSPGHLSQGKCLNRLPAQRRGSTSGLVFGGVRQGLAIGDAVQQSGTGNKYKNYRVNDNNNDCVSCRF